MSNSSITIIGTLCSSTILLIIWGIFRKWPRNLLKLISAAWILSWLGYLIFDLIKTQLGEASIEFQVYGSFFIMIFYACLIIVLAIRYNWSRMTIFQLVMVIGMALIGYLIIIVLSPPVYAALIAMGIMLPFFYFITKIGMGL